MERKGINKTATSLAALSERERKVVKGAITGRRSGGGALGRHDCNGVEGAGPGVRVTGFASRLRRGAPGWWVAKKVDNYDGDEGDHHCTV